MILNEEPIKFDLEENRAKQTALKYPGKLLADEAGEVMVDLTIIKYLAAAYLLWLGFGLIRSQFSKTEPILDDIRPSAGAGNMISSFLAGLLLTLGDVKAIFFYASLLPTFLDLSTLTVMDIAAVSAITIVAVGGVKAIYAISTDKLANLGSGFGYERSLKIASGSMLMLVGGYLALKH